MNTNCHRLAPHQEITTKHACAHECLAAVERQPASSEAVSQEEKSAKNDANTREKNLERAIVIGAVLILILVAVVYYFRFVAPGDSADDLPPLEIQTITRY